LSGRLAAPPRRREDPEARRRDDPELRRQTHGTLDGDALAGIEPDLVVDALRTFCPEPVIRTQNRIRSLRPGEVLLLLADDAGVEVDIPAWCLSTGNEFLGLLAGKDAYRVFVRCGAAVSRTGR
jgi:TusA-related sulfurtransferase